MTHSCIYNHSDAGHEVYCGVDGKYCKRCPHKPAGPATITMDPAILGHKPVTPAWQCCPVCKGTGYNPHIYGDIKQPCAVCNGAKIINTTIGKPPEI